MKSNDKGDQKPKTFGGFLGGAVSHLMRDPHGAEPSEDLNTDGLQKAAERHSLPRKIKELRAEVDQLKKGVRGRTLGKKKEAYIKALIRAVKSANPNYSHAEIATRVDALLGRAKKNFSGVCPPGWRSYQPTARFADVFARPTPNKKLLRLAKAYISKA